MKSIAILGRQPALGIAELESLFGATAIAPFGSLACFIYKHPSEIDFARLGGSLRLCKVLTDLPNDWSAIEKHLLENAPKHAENIDGKLNFGISVFGVKISAKRVASSALALKKALRTSGLSVRMVPHTSLTLNSATVLYNKLTSKNAWELCVISDGKQTYLAQTYSIQDIDAYAARDQARPMRDAKVGMLPPKLAQTIVNLAVNQHPVKAILDPFCGTGVLLQEAMLMGYGQYGTDIEPRMVEFTEKNMSWVAREFGSEVSGYFDVGDATTFRWRAQSFESVACETYLGQPLSTLPPSDQLSKIMHEVNFLHHRFLQNISAQIQSGTRICLAVPTWRGKHEFLHLPALAHLTEMGYNRVKFKHVSDDELIYHREGQVVGRELLVLEKQ